MESRCHLRLTIRPTVTPSRSTLNTSNLTYKSTLTHANWLAVQPTRWKFWRPQTSCNSISGTWISPESTMQLTLKASPSPLTNQTQPLALSFRSSLTEPSNLANPSILASSTLPQHLARPSAGLMLTRPPAANFPTCSRSAKTSTAARLHHSRTRHQTGSPTRPPSPPRRNSWLR